MKKINSIMFLLIAFGRVTVCISQSRLYRTYFFLLWLTGQLYSETLGNDSLLAQWPVTYSIWPWIRFLFFHIYSQTNIYVRRITLNHRYNHTFVYIFLQLWNLVRQITSHNNSVSSSWIWMVFKLKRLVNQIIEVIEN